jgi:hypothetical protein
VTAPLTPEQHAERIRNTIKEAFRVVGYVGAVERRESLDALDALLALLADAEARAAINEHQCDDMTASALDAYARVEAAEARVAELQAALRKIAEIDDPADVYLTKQYDDLRTVADMVRAARAALGEPSR